MNTPRTLIIGLDGATFDLLDPLIRAGYMPVLEGFMAQGAHGSLRSCPNLNSAAAWSSIITGCNPGRHGIYDFGAAWDTPPKEGFQWQPTTGANRKKDPFWRILSAAGQRMGIINVPMSYPAEQVNGFMLAGMDAPSIYSPGFAHPSNLLDELVGQGIDYMIDVPNLAVFSSRNPYQIPSPAKRMISARCRTVLYLMESRPWDLFMAVFTITDRMQHFFWPNENTPIEDRSWDPIRSIYRQIDSFLARALELIDNNTTLLLVSDHGFGPMRLGMRCLNPLFAQLGLLRYRRGKSSIEANLLRSMLSYGRMFIPVSFQDSVARAFPRLHQRAVSEQKFRSIEWSHTQVYANPSGREIFVNLKGREPHGAVSPKDYDSLIQRVVDILLNLIDPHSGRSVIRTMHRREDIYNGPFLEKAPDLTIEWDYNALRESLCYPLNDKPIIAQPVKGMGAGERWTANHRPDGIFIVCGPHIKGETTVKDANIYDIAPTVLYLQNNPIPRDMDGKVLTGIFTEEHLRQNPVQYGDPANIGSQAADPGLDAEEARKVEERLRGLGYIE